MLDLSTHKAPFDIALPYGLTVTVKPLTTAGMAAAQAAARRPASCRRPAQGGGKSAPGALPGKEAAKLGKLTQHSRPPKS